MNMKRSLLALLWTGILSFLTLSVNAQFSLTSSSYTQDFNTLLNTGTTNALTLPGWSLNETGGGARDNELYAGDNGGSGTGDTYSYGTIAATERALGSLQSGTLISSYGFYFTNNTGSTITSLRFEYTGEQWRLGTASRTDRLDFQYSADATSLTTGTWTNADQLDFITPNTVGTGAKDGNAAGNRTSLVATVGGLNIPVGSTFFIRWQDFGASGADDGLAIDDFTLTVNPPDGTAPVATQLVPQPGAVNVVLNPNCAISFSEPIQAGSGDSLRVFTGATQVVALPIDSMTINGSSVSFTLRNLSAATSYYITIPPTFLKDTANNFFAGFSLPTEWSFSTFAALPTAYNWDFNACGNLSGGYSQFSVTGTQVWSCTAFGRTYPGSGPSSDSALQMSGFSGTAQLNEDWLISPQLDLSGFADLPLLRFYSRGAFTGPNPQLKVSTNYKGGNPALATWTDLNGRFPAAGVNVWTLSDSINLNSFKGVSVYIAWVYTSNPTDGAARWTLDDVSIFNSPVAAAPDITVTPNSFNFGYIGFGGSSAWRPFSFNASDLLGDITLTAPPAFEISKDGITPGTSILYTPAQASGTQVFYVRFVPTADDVNLFSGQVAVTGTGISKTKLALSGSSLALSSTLDVVNWNIEWFGSTANGPTDLNQQQTNVQTVMNYLNADIYGVSEIVDTARLGNVTRNLAGGYSFVIADYCSFAPNGADPDWITGQKTGFVYRTSMFSNVSVRGMLRDHATQAATDSASYWWASGRFPFLMNADVTLNGATRNMNFIIIHAKANTGTDPEKVEAYRRRKMAVTELKDTLDAFYSSSHVILFGDYNDDLDRTIAPITSGPDTISSYSYIIADSTDADSYKSISLALSRSGQASTSVGSDVIDHQIVSNEMFDIYVPGTIGVRTDAAATVTNFFTTTTDHYPVYSRFYYKQPLPSNLNTFEAVKVNRQQVKLKWGTDQEINSSRFIVERSANGRDWTAIANVAAAGNSSLPRYYQAFDNAPLSGLNLYRLKKLDLDNSFRYSTIERVLMGDNMIFSLNPNPAAGYTDIFINRGFAGASMQVLDMNGRMVLQQKLNASGSVRLNLNGWKAGVYALRLSNGTETQTLRLVVR